MKRYDPYAHADELGITVLHRKIRTANGLWLPDHNTIVIRSGMRAVHDRSTLAHEIAHSILGHWDGRPKHEIQADRLASENLIDLEECLDIMRGVPDETRLAHELGVSTRLMRAFLAVHHLAG